MSVTLESLARQLPSFTVHSQALNAEKKNPGLSDSGSIVSDDEVNFGVGKTYALTHKLADVYIPLIEQTQQRNQLSSDGTLDPAGKAMDSVDSSLLWLLFSCHNRLIDLWHAMLVHARMVQDTGRYSPDAVGAHKARCARFRMGSYEPSSSSTVVAMEIIVLQELAMHLASRLNDLIEVIEPDNSTDGPPSTTEDKSQNTINTDDSGHSIATICDTRVLQPSTVWTDSFRVSNEYLDGGSDHRMSQSDSSKMSTNRPFLANFLAAFRAQSTFKAPSAAGSQTSSQIASGARAMATKTTSSTTSSTPTTTPLSSSQNATTSANPSSSPQNQQQHHHPHHRSHHHHPPHHRPSPSTTRPQSHSRTPATIPTTTTATENTSPTSTSPTSGPIPIVYNHDRRRRGSDSSSGSGGFRDALGHEKWYIGGRSATGEERFYRLGMVTKAGGRIGATGRVGSVDQLSL
uniref:Transcription factor ACEII n=2 Tax=Talaromyces marneffei TaxID=37727 RepID=A0A093VDN5_TALMA